jgi:hypothetical protein
MLDALALAGSALYTANLRKVSPAGRGVVWCGWANRVLSSDEGQREKAPRHFKGLGVQVDSDFMEVLAGPKAVRRHAVCQEYDKKTQPVRRTSKVTLRDQGRQPRAQRAKQREYPPTTSQPAAMSGP